MKQKKVFDKAIIFICILVMLVAAVSIVTRFLTRQILIERLDVNNAFTKFVWFDNSAAGEFEEGVENVEIDWEKQYPFKNSTDIPAYVDNSSRIEKYTKTISDIEGKIESYATDLLAFQKNIVEAAAKYEDIIGWDVVSYNEYNGIVKMPDGYLVEYVEQRDATEQYIALRNFREYCQSIGSEFVFVTAPYKISEYEDSDISGSLDFSNQNANQLNQLLIENDIDAFDIRKVIHAEGLHNHGLFYRTDHHWLTTTGMWGAQKVLEYCNKEYGWNCNTERLDLSNFEIEEYPNTFLGSQGKKVTLSRTTPDDFSLLYPTFDVKLHYQVPSRNVDLIGDYSVCYDMTALGHDDYYKESSYSVCNYGDKPVINIENLLYDEDKSILIIHDSFGDTLISGLALGVHNVYSLDIRHFTGSVQTYIEEKKPDLVMVLYNPSGIGKKIDYSEHKDEFDFR